MSAQPRSRAGGRTYWFYEAPSAKIEASDPLAALRQERWPDPFAALVAATDPAGLLVNRIRTLPRLNVWGRGTTVLLGDAAHAMAPNLGQGAAQAIEDAHRTRGRSAQPARSRPP